MIVFGDGGGYISLYDLRQNPLVRRARLLERPLHSCLAARLHSCLAARLHACCSLLGKRGRWRGRWKGVVACVGVSGTRNAHIVQQLLTHPG